MKKLFCENRMQWRQWLLENGAKEREIWLFFYKKESGRSCIDYDDALDEALCFGWIDSIVKRIDDQRYARKFNKRNAKSKWSPKNKQRVKELIRQNRMTEAGFAVINSAKQNGSWNRPDRPEITDDIPSELRQALKNNKEARVYFESLAPGYRRQYVLWISSAKRPETREKRAKEAIGLLNKKEKLGLK